MLKFRQPMVRGGTPEKAPAPRQISEGHAGEIADEKAPEAEPEESATAPEADPEESRRRAVSTTPDYVSLADKDRPGTMTSEGWNRSLPKGSKPLPGSYLVLDDTYHKIKAEFDFEFFIILNFFRFSFIFQFFF